jgi:hypothetical protein
MWRVRRTCHCGLAFAGHDVDLLGGLAEVVVLVHALIDLLKGAEGLDLDGGEAGE